jgi:hypothetical protein
MRTSIASLSLLFAAIVAGADLSWAQAVHPPPIDGKPGTIRGRIIAADTGKPLRRARVTIRPQTTGTPPISANTNSLGQFEAANVPAGAYFISAARAGYLETQYGQRRPAERGVTVDVAPAQSVDRIEISLPRGGVLTGRITDELGEPYPGVRVDAVALGYRMGKRVPSPAGVATTDDLGHFRIAGLLPGSYYVVASSTETWAAEKNATHGYASTYFPGGSMALAQVISLGASQQRHDLNFSLQSGRTARITGRVQREDGQPSSSAQVRLAYSYPGSGSIMTYGMRSVRAAADGTFEIKDVPGGAYSVMAGGDGRDVIVAGADIDDVLLIARTVSTVMGTVITEDRVPPPFSPSGVRIVADAPVGKILPRMGNVSVENDWSFKYGLGGPFLFRVIGLPDSWTVRAVRLDDKDITDTPWDVPTGGKEISGLTIVVTRTISRVSGTVVDNKGQPTAVATVVVFPEESALWIPYSRLIKVARPTTDGRFSITGLPAGTYRAIARESIEEGQWEDRAFLEQVRDDAVRFVLVDGGSEAITLKLPPPR